MTIWRKVILIFLLLGFSLSGWSQSRPRRAPAAASQNEVPYLYAGAFDHELVASGTSGLLSSGQEQKDSKEKVTRVSIEAEYRYQFSKGVQVGILAHLQSISAGTTSNCAEAFITTTYNFTPTQNLIDAAYLTGALGMADENCGLKDSQKKVAFLLAFGKRIKLAERIAYSPEVGGKKIADNETIYFLKFLNFSFTF